MRYGDEVRDEEAYFADIGDGNADSDLMPLVQHLIKRKATDWNPKLVVDPVQDHLLDIINARKKHLKKTGKVKPNSTEPEPSNVINIMDALRKSVQAETRSEK